MAGSVALPGAEVDVSPPRDLRARRRTTQAIHALNALPGPTLAPTQGACHGSGVGMVACCDIAIATASVRFGCPEVRRGIYLELTVPLVPPKTGRTINLEKPAAFNQAVADFLAQARAGRWLPRDRRARPDEILKTS